MHAPVAQRLAIRVRHYGHRRLQLVEIIRALQIPAGGITIFHHDITPGAGGQSYEWLSFQAGLLQALGLHQRSCVNQEHVPQRELLRTRQPQHLEAPPEPPSVNSGCDWKLETRRVLPPSMLRRS